MTGKPGVLPSSVPDSVRHLALDVVEESMIRHGASVTSAAQELGVSISDLRKLCFAVPRLMDVALDHEEKRIDLAEQRIDEALRSADSRRHDVAAQFVLRNMSRARRRGWTVPSATDVNLSVNANLPPRQMVFRWRTPEDDQRDAEAAEAERLREEGKTVISIGWATLTTARPSSMNLVASLRTRTKILATA